MSKFESILTCEKCGVTNYLDPYTFWDFEGNFKCAGCGKLYFIQRVNGRTVKGPSDAKGTDFTLPGCAEKREGNNFIPMNEPGKVSPPAMASAVFLGKPKPITKNIRGNLVAGRPLKPEELKGGIWKEIYD